LSQDKYKVVDMAADRKSEGWKIEYTVEMFPEDITEKDRKGISMEGYIPVLRDGEIVGRAYLSKFEPPGMKKEPPTMEIRIIPKENDVASH
jgi:hypothetical protein